MGEDLGVFSLREKRPITLRGVRCCLGLAAQLMPKRGVFTKA